MLFPPCLSAEEFQMMILGEIHMIADRPNAELPQKKNNSSAAKAQRCFQRAIEHARKQKTKSRECCTSIRSIAPR
jgi:hypothetical protein